MRRRLPWLLALPLMASGSISAHAVNAWFVGGPPTTEHGRELAERSSTSAGAHSVVGLGIVAALLVLAGASWFRARIRGDRRGASPSLFFWLPPLAFSAQEIGERLLHAEAAPFNAALEPRFLIGLALQIPFGLAALLLARLVLRMARRIVEALARPRPGSLRRRSTLARPLVGCVPPRIPALALGYPERGPPSA